MSSAWTPSWPPSWFETLSLGEAPMSDLAHLLAPRTYPGGLAPDRGAFARAPRGGAGGARGSPPGTARGGLAAADNSGGESVGDPRQRGDGRADSVGGPASSWFRRRPRRQEAKEP